MTRSSSAPARRACIAPRSPASAVGASCWSTTAQPRRQDPHLRRRALQFHQYRRNGRQFPLRQPAFRQVGPVAPHPGRFPRPGRTPRHRLARKDPRPIVLRRLGQADRRHAARRMRRGARSIPPSARRRRSSIATASSTSTAPLPRRWSSPPAACRSPSSAPPRSPTTPPAASASRSSSRARRWCR